jgi:hypothetical protein
LARFFETELVLYPFFGSGKWVYQEWFLFQETFSLGSNPAIIRKVIPAFASDPGPKKTGVL